MESVPRASRFGTRVSMGMPLCAALLVFAMGCGRTGYPEDGVPATWRPSMQAWERRTHLVVDNGQRAETLTDFPLLIHLDGSRIDYSAVSPGGRDLRFVDEDGSVLSYEVEQWQAGGDSYIWLRMPRLPERANRDVWLYHGNRAAPSVEDAAAVWRNGYLAVYHFAGSTSAVAFTSAANNGVTFGGTLLGPHATFNGTDAYMSVPAGWSDFGGGVSIEAWVRPARPTVYARVIDFGNGEAIDNLVFYREGTTDVLTYEVHDPGARVLEPGVITDGVWQHLAVSHDASGVVGLYKDGALLTTATNIPLPSAVTRTLNFIGRSNWVTDELFAGDMDELRISNVPRSAEWMDAQHASMTEQMVVFDEIQQR